MGRSSISAFFRTIPTAWAATDVGKRAKENVSRPSSGKGKLHPVRSAQTSRPHILTSFRCDGPSTDTVAVLLTPSRNRGMLSRQADALRAPPGSVNTCIISAAMGPPPRGPAPEGFPEGGRPYSSTSVPSGHRKFRGPPSRGNSRSIADSLRLAQIHMACLFSFKPRPSRSLGGNGNEQKLRGADGRTQALGKLRKARRRCARASPGGSSIWSWSARVSETLLSEPSGKVPGEDRCRFPQMRINSEGRPRSSSSPMEEPSWGFSPTSPVVPLPQGDRLR